MRAASLLRRLLAAALVVGIGATLYHGGLVDESAVRQLAAAAGGAAPVAFLAGYALATVLFVPGSILTLAGGALFGPAAGTFYSLTGATLGATFAFLLARYLASDWAARRSGGRLAEFVRGVESEGWRFVAFVRLVPLFPFNALNYALGLTRIPLAQYVAASYVAMLPGALAYTWLGYAGREALAGSANMIQNGLIALALLATALFLPRLARRLRRSPAATIEPGALRERLERGDEPAILDVRGGDEFHGELGHIAGALNLPLPELSRSLSRIEMLKERQLVVVCRTDRRSSAAAELLRSAGWRVEVLSGGMVLWNKLGYAVIRHGQEPRHP